MKRHILFIVENNSYPSDLRVAAEALSLKKYGYDVSVISATSSTWPKKRETIEGIEVYRHRTLQHKDRKADILLEYFNALFWELFLSFKIMAKKRIHYIHGANPPDHIFLIAMIFRIFGVEYVFDHHDLSPEMYLSKFGKKDFFYKILFIMEKLTFNFAKIVISTNESYKKIAIKRGGKRDSEVFVVRNGPRLEKIQTVSPNPMIKQEFKYLAVYLGVIGRQERLDVLLEAVSYIVNVKKVHNIRFLVVGPGPYLANIMNLAKHMNLDKYVSFTGYISDEALAQIMATADICVDPEFKNDFSDKSTMLKTMYYMAFGKPIVQFDKKENKYTAKDASVYVKNNNVVDFAEMILALLNDEEKRTKMAMAGKARIQDELNWDRQKENLKKAYDFLYAN